jgi:hypothetical protein
VRTKSPKKTNRSKTLKALLTLSSSTKTVKKVKEMAQEKKTTSSGAASQLQLLRTIMLERKTKH